MVKYTLMYRRICPAFHGTAKLKNGLSFLKSHHTQKSKMINQAYISPASLKQGGGASSSPQRPGLETCQTTRGIWGGRPFAASHSYQTDTHWQLGLLSYCFPFWNSLPSKVCRAPSFQSFQKVLKTLVFQRAFYALELYLPLLCVYDF